VLRTGVVAVEFEAMCHHHGEARRVTARERLRARMHLSAESVPNVRHRN
jgi:hypothetical protein